MPDPKRKADAMRKCCIFVLLLLLAALPLLAQGKPPASLEKTHSTQAATPSKAAGSQPTPTVFQANEGDRWMLHGEKLLIFKVDPISTGSSSFVVGMEEMPPGSRIPAHKHLHEDEVIFVDKGTVRVTLAGRQYEAGTGATAFIPHGNWMQVENVSRQPAMILFFFNKPAYEKCLRAMSSRPGEKFTMPSAEKMALVRQQCDEVMKN